MLIDKAAQMDKPKILDTNIVINFVNKKSNAINLNTFFMQYNCAISVITKLELLGFSKIKKQEEKDILDLLPKIPILPINEAIEAETIEIRRKTRLKLPDAIIAATAIVLSAELVTTDEHFLKCTYPKLVLWKAKN